MKNKLPLFYQITFIIIISAIASGCASIIGKGAAEVLNVRSTPDQATVVITDESGSKIFEGKTPTNIPLEKKKGYFSGKTYFLKISKEGYADKTITVNTKANGWYIGGNFLFGGLIGWLIVDPLTGAMWTLDTEKVDVTLDAGTAGAFLENDGTGIVLLENVPLSLRDKMVKVTN